MSLTSGVSRLEVVISRRKLTELHLRGFRKHGVQLGVQIPNVNPMFGMAFGRDVLAMTPLYVYADVVSSSQFCGWVLYI